MEHRRTASTCCPATIELATAEQLLLTRTGREQLLKTALAPVLKRYDVILLDCPPTLGDAHHRRADGRARGA